MRLAAATRLGPYEVVSALGAGGMGEVYRARDTRLGREVALKVLPISRYDDPALLARFEREAQALAALNHPHIAAIYDVVDVGDYRAIVMELVAGSTLAEVIASGPVLVGAAIDYATDISDALSAAHALGIVHRDLKPENIVITEGGSAKLLDFGIAKLALSDDAVTRQSTKAALTGELALIGTIRYMSPEQANGRPVDARSDIFSLGIVLHEAISGRPAFHGDTAATLISSVLRDDPPPLRTLVSTTPRALERCVTRCLEKDSRRRYQSAADLKAVLEDIREDLAAPDTISDSDRTVVSTRVRVTRRVLRSLPYVAAGLTIGAVGLVAGGARRSSVVITPRYRPFITEVTLATNPTWSPDGRTLAYVDDVNGHSQVFLRGIDAVRSTPVTRESVAPVTAPFWSPDSTKLYFTRASDGNLLSIGAAGENLS
jgi:eukaryotic-like serine/threonine-protein kinase